MLKVVRVSAVKVFESSEVTAKVLLAKVEARTRTWPVLWTTLMNFSRHEFGWPSCVVGSEWRRCRSLGGRLGGGVGEAKGREMGLWVLNGVCGVGW